MSVGVSVRGVIAAASESLRQNGFAPSLTRAGKAGKPSNRTLHEAIREAVGIDLRNVDDCDLAYWEWRDLRLFLDEVWSALDESACQILGEKVKMVAVAAETSCEEETVLQIMDKAQPKLNIDCPTLTRRPDRKSSIIPLRGKPLWAILVTIGVLESQPEVDLGDLLSSLSGLNINDEDFIKLLDQQVTSAGIDIAKLGPSQKDGLLRELGRAFQRVNRVRARNDDPPLRFSQFLTEMEDSANWSGNSDDAILHRLLKTASEIDKPSVKETSKTTRGE